MRRTHKKKVYKVVSKMEKIIESSQNEETEQADEHKDKDRSDLNKVAGHKTFDYEYMLQRIADSVGETQAGKTDFKLHEPKCARTATKSSWVNFDKQAKAMDREPNHVLGFFKNELGCNGTIGQDNMLILNGGY